MRPQPDLPRQPRRKRREGRRLVGRGRLIIGVGLVALFFLLISLRGAAKIYTDYLWFDSLELGGVWTKVLTTKIVLTLVGAVVFFALCWTNLLIAERLAPVFRPSTGEDDFIERYHELVGRRAWMVRGGVSLALALVVGLSLGSAWNQWLLFANHVPFGEKDATFHTDIGFYVFQLPFLTTVAGWLFSSILLVLFVTLLAHVVNGGIRFQTQLDRVTPQVKAHISVLLALLAAIQVVRYWLDRYQLTFSTRGKVDGATYTAVNVELRVLYLLMAIGLFAVGLFIANIWRRGWVLPIMAVGLWALVTVLAGTLVPSLVQRLRVEPNELSFDGPYVRHNIDATRAAYGLDDVDVKTYDASQRLDVEDLEQNIGTLANVRLWDPSVTQANFVAQQKVRNFYAINDVDVDRYVIDGKPTQVMVAARDLSDTGVPTQSWEASHLAYTHGYGVVASVANDKESSGDPDLVAQNIPIKTTSGLPEVEVAGTYFGEDKSGYVIVDTKRKEIDYQLPSSSTKYTTYEGEDGVRIGSGTKGFMRKAAFALRFGDINPLVSSNITADSKVIFERDVTARVKSIAPFLAYDHDPYIVMLKDGRLKYVLDGYTTSRNYPNAQRADTGGLDRESGLRGRSFNYARNSVKAVVDAYDGSVTLYIVDTEDPMIKAYSRAFPELFTPVSKASKDLRAHFRFPEDLFTVQTQMWGKYHVNEVDVFLNADDFWDVPQATGASTTGSNDEKTTTTELGADGQPLTPDDRYASQYLLMQLPGEEEERFVVLRPYSPASGSGSANTAQNQLRAFIVAGSDPDDYGKFRSYLLPASELPAGPSLAASDMKSNGEISARLRALCTDQNRCTYTSPTIVPVEGSMLYVQSVFVAGTQVDSPKLEQVIVSYQRGGDPAFAIDSNLHDALVQIFGTRVPDGIQSTGNSSTNSTDGENGEGENGESGSKGTVAEQQADLIDKLTQAFEDADAAAKKGDQVAYAENIEKAERYAKQLQDLQDKVGTSTEPEGSSTSNGSSGSTTTTTRPTTTTEPKATTTSRPKVTTTTSAGA